MPTVFLADSVTPEETGQLFSVSAMRMPNARMALRFLSLLHGNPRKPGLGSHVARNTARGCDSARLRFPQGRAGCLLRLELGDRTGWLLQLRCWMTCAVGRGCRNTRPRLFVYIGHDHLRTVLLRGFCSCDVLTSATRMELIISLTVRGANMDAVLLATTRERNSVVRPRSEFPRLKSHVTNE